MLAFHSIIHSALFIQQTDVVDRCSRTQANIVGNELIIHNYRTSSGSFDGSGSGIFGTGPSLLGALLSVAAAKARGWWRQ
jgi:hypothetical protein